MTTTATPPAAGGSGRSWRRRLLLTTTVLAALLILGFLASATVPRWWAQRVGDQVGGSITQGVLVGVVYGFLFTLLPIAVLAATLRWRRTWRATGIALCFAVVLALPNLMTLGIVIGRGNAAHAGDRILDVEAPAFRGATLGGVILAVGVAGFIGYLLASRRRARSQATHAREQLASSRTQTAVPDDEPPGER